MRIHYLQHVPFENPGSILEWAIKNGHTLTSTQMYKDEPLPQQKDFDWLIVMGGPMNIYEEDIYPWLAAEKIFIKESITHKKILMGLCLGGQLIADVLGGKVTKNPHKEIGWFGVRLTEIAKSSPLFSFFPLEPTVFQWHGDTFSILPEGAELLASSDACEHQAFVYDKRVFGFQYHLENTREIIEGLVENCSDEIVLDRYVQSTEDLLGHPEYIKQDNEWMEMFLTRLEQLYNEGKI
ncbi:MAG: type 1 glutamine amidotransferase [Candidatus Marinarcus sp.]|uniref:type 1 glutamine amidotransferase n=1 Tax=Candidatus Marinarcus sp. TaxID=3100987 RepID=UPI003B00103C